MSDTMHVAAIPESLDFPDVDKPYVELVRGRLCPKVSPKRTHGRLALRMGRLLEDWAGDRGVVAVEWRFYLLESGAPSSLVPDVAYVSYSRLPREASDDARERPRLAPDIAVEVLSPGDRLATLEVKVALYHAHGSEVVAIIDPRQRLVQLRYRDGTRTEARRGSVVVDGFPDLSIDIAALFADL